MGNAASQVPGAIPRTALPRTLLVESNKPTQQFSHREVFLYIYIEVLYTSVFL